MARSKKNKRKKIKQGKRAIILAVAILFVVLSVEKASLNKKSAVYAQKQQQLQDEIDDAKKEKKAIEEQEKYMQTKKYVEEVAKDKLGLVYPKEKVFKEKEEN